MARDEPKEPARPPAISRLGATLALLSAWVAFFSAQLFTDGVPYYRDHLVTMLPLRHYITERLTRGELPQWYPYESLGVPLIGQIATSLFHPATLLVLPFDIFTGLKGNLLLTYWVASIGAYRLARSLPASRFAALVAAVAFAYGGYGLGVSSILFYAMSHATLPWVATFALRLVRDARAKDSAYLAIAWALVFLAGDAQGFLLCGVVIGALLLARWSRRSFGLVALAGLTTFLLCAVEYLPAHAVTRQALRVVGEASPLLGSTWNVPPLRLPELFIAGYIPDAARTRVLTELLSGGQATFCTTLFAGSLVLLFAAAGVTMRQPLTRVWCGIAGLALWLSLGDAGGLLRLVSRVVPLFTRFRYPEKYMAFFWLGLCPLVALGVERALRERRRFRTIIVTGGLLTGVAALFVGFHGLARVAWNLGSKPMSDGDPLADLMDQSWGAGLLWAATFLVLAGLALAASRRRDALAWALPVLVFAELWQVNAEHLPLVPRDWLASTPPFAAAIAGTQEPNTPLGRVLDEPVKLFPLRVSDLPEERHLWTRSWRNMLRPNTGGLYGITSLGQNMGAVSVRHNALLGFKATRAMPFAGRLNTCFHVADLRRDLRPGEEELAQDPETSMKLLRVPCLPRAFLSATRTAQTLAEALRMSRETPADAIAWERGPAMPAAEGTVTWLTDAPEHLALEVQTPGDTALIIANEPAPGWRALLDGTEVPIYHAMVAAGGVVVPVGTHRVDWVYRTPLLLPGAMGSGLGLALAGWLSAGAWARRRSAWLLRLRPTRKTPPGLPTAS